MCSFLVVMKPQSTLVFFQLLLISVSSDSSSDKAQEITASTACAGCVTEQDPNDPVYYNLAKQSIKKYLLDQDIIVYYAVTRVNNARTQVVSGKSIKIDFNAAPTNCTSAEEPDASSCVVLGGTYINCQSDIWEQVWLDSTSINISCENKSRRKRALVRPGGKKEQDPNEEQYKELAIESLEKYVTDNGLTESYVVLRVIKVTTQVVSGTNTDITFVARFESSDEFTCQSEIWDRPWLNDKRINVTCDYRDC